MIVNNSWGGKGGNKFFDPVLKGWKEAGIVSFFAAGNEYNKECGLVGSPSDSPDTISVGSTDNADKISTFSSVGPTKDGRRKPDISAPGTDIVSSWPTGKSKYAQISGTSMACPHAAGTAALIVSYYKKNGLSYTISDVTNAMQKGVVPVKPKMQTCGGITDDVYPNNHVGYGRIDAKLCVAKAMSAKKS